LAVAGRYKNTGQVKRMQGSLATTLAATVRKKKFGS
jgi:hypothetical protein